MEGQLNSQPDYVVEIRSTPTGSAWAVKTAHRQAMAGAAPNEGTARRCAQFAAATLAALDRIGRRNF